MMKKFVKFIFVVMAIAFVGCKSVPEKNADGKNGLQDGLTEENIGDSSENAGSKNEESQGKKMAPEHAIQDSESADEQNILGSWQTVSLEKDGIMQQIAISGITFEKPQVNFGEDEDVEFLDGESDVSDLSNLSDLYEVYGNSGVNNFFGDIGFEGGKPVVGDRFGSTRMAGPADVMEFEDLFMDCLMNAVEIKIERNDSNNGDLLKIVSKKPNSVLTFKRDFSE